MNKEFILSVFHPDEGVSYLFYSYIDLKKWRKHDGYKYPIEDGGCCYYTYHTSYTMERLKEAKDRFKRYWKNKDIENQRCKVYREKQKLVKMLELNNDNK